MCVLQDQRPVTFTTEVYDGLVESPSAVRSSGWDKRPSDVSKSSQHLAPPSSSIPHHHHYHHHHHLGVPRGSDKKDTQLSPLKKRVKEGTPPVGMKLIGSNVCVYAGCVFIIIIVLVECVSNRGIRNRSSPIVNSNSNHHWQHNRNMNGNLSSHHNQVKNILLHPSPPSPPSKKNSFSH